MTKNEKMLALRSDPNVHYNCAQSVLIPFAAEMGITEEQACALAANFGSGMGCGSACGALVGALMALGGLGQPLEKRSELACAFREHSGGRLNCPELLKASAEQGIERKTHCDGLVNFCLDWVCKETGIE